MRWPVLLTLVVTALSGCLNPARDPFFGPQTVPPPGTGDIGTPLTSLPQPPDESYYNSGNGTNTSSTGNTTITPNSSFPPTSGTSTGSPFVPPGGSYEYNGSTTQNNNTTADPGFRPPSQVTPVSSGSSGFNNNQGSGASGVPIRSVSPEDSAPGAGASSSSTYNRNGQAFNPPPSQPLVEPSGLTAANDASVRDIGSLPRTGNETAFRTASNVKTVNYQSDQAVDQSGGAATANLGSSSYGLDTQYRWLRGKLEYSKFERRWKLRYIPISGETDQFGGSVVLVDSVKLSNFQPGEFVTVHGNLIGEDAALSGFAPKYEVTKITATR